MYCIIRYVLQKCRSVKSVIVKDGLVHQQCAGNLCQIQSWLNKIELNTISKHQCNNELCGINYMNFAKEYALGNKDSIAICFIDLKV